MVYDYLVPNLSVACPSALFRRQKSTILWKNTLRWVISCVAWSSCTYKRWRVFRKRSKTIIWSFSGSRNEALLSSSVRPALSSPRFVQDSSNIHLNSIIVLAVHAISGTDLRWAPPDTRGISGLTGLLNLTYDMFASFGRAFQVSCLSRSSEEKNWPRHDLWVKTLCKYSGVRLCPSQRLEKLFEVDLTTGRFDQRYQRSVSSSRAHGFSSRKMKYSYWTAGL